MKTPPPPSRKPIDEIPLELIDGPLLEIATDAAPSLVTEIVLDLLEEEVGLDVVQEQTGLDFVHEETQIAPVPEKRARAIEPHTARTRLAVTHEPRGAEHEHRLRLRRPEEWCRVCGTRHETGECPGELLATGSERHGWRATFETPHGTRETHVVLIAPASGRWRARIMTYPRALWTLPSCPRTIKFLGDHPREAERLARELVEEHCRGRECKRIHQESSNLEISSFEREEVQARTDEEAARRRPRVLPVKFGADGQSMRASMTADLSEHGLFIATDEGLAQDTSLRLVLELPGAQVPLRGTVRWARAETAPGRPAGVGIQLSRVPAIYLHYVRSIP